jgi:hypothetical protein
MIKHEYNADLDMQFSDSSDWHIDIILPPDASISEIHLRVYSFSYPENIYSISWGDIRRQDDQLQFPIDAWRYGSEESEAVRLAINITYYRN